MRLLASSFLLTAAFGWPLPFLDRPGVALLGLACWSLSAGRGLVAPRPASPHPGAPPILGRRARPEPVPPAILERLRGYGIAGQPDAEPGDV